MSDDPLLLFLRIVTRRGVLFLAKMSESCTALSRSSLDAPSDTVLEHPG